MTLTEFIHTAEYSQIASTWSNEFGFALYPVYSDVLLSIMQTRLDKSELPLLELISTLKDEQEAFKNYVRRVISLLHGKPIEQEHAKNEPPDEDDDWKPGKDLGVSKDFLILHLISYILAKSHPDRLEKYLIDNRTPGAKNHARQLLKIYRESAGG